MLKGPQIPLDNPARPVLSSGPDDQQPEDPATTTNARAQAAEVDAGLVSRHLAWVVSGLADHRGASIEPVDPRDPSSFYVPPGMSRARTSAYVAAVLDSLSSYEELRLMAEGPIRAELAAAFAHDTPAQARARLARETARVASYVLPRAQLARARFSFRSGEEAQEAAAAMTLVQPEGGDASARVFGSRPDPRSVFEASRERASASADAFDSVVFGGADASRLVSREPGVVLESLIFRSAAGGDAPGPAAPYRDLRGDPSQRVFLRQILRHVTLRFAVKVSFAADEEESCLPPGGRLRARPSQWAVLRGLPHEFYVPWPFKEGEMAERFVAAAERLSAAAVSVDTPYLLPSATCVRAMDVADAHSFVESANEALCLRSCQERWWKAREEVAAVAAAEPALETMFGPACLHASRAGSKNPCPHRGKYCGFQAWRADPAGSRRRL